MAKKKKNKGATIAIAAVAAAATIATAGAAAPLGAAVLSGTSLAGSTIAASTVGGAIIGGGIGAAAGGATGSLTGDFGKGLTQGALTGAAGGAAGGLASSATGAYVAPEFGLQKGTPAYSALTGAAGAGASGAAKAAVTGGDVGKAAALGGATGAVTGALFPVQYDAQGKAIEPTFGEGVAKAGTSALTSYGLQQAFPETFAQKGQSRVASVEPSGGMAAGGSPYATASGPSALAAGLRVGAPELPAEGAAIPGEKKLEPQRPVWNISSLRTMSEEAA